jgi:hypothetical protein
MSETPTQDNTTFSSDHSVNMERVNREIVKGAVESALVAIRLRDIEKAATLMEIAMKALTKGF